MVTEQSNLTTLAALAKGAEARTPLPLPKSPDESSGLIDIHEIERRAKEQRAQLELARASATPPPFVHHGPGAASEPDVFAKMNAKRQRRVRQIAVAIGSALAVVGIAIAVMGSGSKSEPAPARAAVVVREAPPVVVPAAVVAPAPVVAAPALAATPAPPSTSEAASAPVPAHKSKGSKAHHAKASHASHGPKLMKVNSGGT